MTARYMYLQKAISSYLKTHIPKQIINGQTGFINKWTTHRKQHMAHRYGYQLYRCKKNYKYPTLSNFCLEKTFNTLITFCSLTLIFINRNPLIIHQSKTFDWNLESCILNYGWQVLFCPQGIPKGYLLFLFLVLLLLFLLLLLLSVLLFQK